MSPSGFTRGKSSNFGWAKGMKIPLRLEKSFSKKIGTDYLYDHPDVYDLAYEGYAGDIKFYREEAAKGKILYLGSGSGRIFLNLYKINKNVYGLDYSKKMVEHLLNKNPNIDKKNLIFANVLDAKIPLNSFDTIIAPFSFLTQFEEKEVKKILENCKKWLNPDGKIITDFFSPYLNPSFQKKFVDAFFKKNKSGIKVWSYEFYDHIAQKLYEFTLVENKNVKYIAQLNLNYYYPNEIKKIASEIGLNVKNIWGDFKRNDLTTRSKVMIFVLSKKK